MSERMNDVIWVCHSSACEGTWIESTGNDQDDKICPSVDCENKNTTPYVKRSTITALQAKLEKSAIALETMMKRYRYVWGECENEPEYSLAKATLKDLEGEQ